MKPRDGETDRNKTFLSVFGLFWNKHSRKLETKLVAITNKATHPIVNNNQVKISLNQVSKIPLQKHRWLNFIKGQQILWQDRACRLVIRCWPLCEHQRCGIHIDCGTLALESAVLSSRMTQYFPNVSSAPVHRTRE